MNVETNIKDVLIRIKAAAERTDREASNIQLVVVSKNVSLEKIEEAYKAGQKNFGENRVQEWMQKHSLLPGNCEWHIIGRLQTNKIKYLNERVTLIHSLDRFSLLEKLNSEGEKNQIIWPTLVQVNVARDQAKAGLEIEEVKDFLLSAKDFPYVRVSGLMTIGALKAEPEETRGYFRKLRELRDNLLRQGVGNEEELKHLSMGMSQDYELAVEEGATIVRIGSKIFG
ncbi:MAG: pyridoxal phosphate biosynthesis protein [Gracilibacter sp. BRH_c7a]|nr:MAG: pyridoxal phosphate biosynthesis protein [Gracilibacter sp. BRH_c7a]